MSHKNLSLIRSFTFFFLLIAFVAQAQTSPEPTPSPLPQQSPTVTTITPTAETTSPEEQTSAAETDDSTAPVTPDKTTPPEEVLPPVDPVVAAVSTVFSGDFAQAKKQAEVLITAKPQDPTGYLLRGMANDWSQFIADQSLDETVMADYEKAVELARAAVQSDPNNLDAQVLLGNSLMYLAKKHVDQKSKMKAGQILKESSQIMEKVIAQDPSRSDAFFAIGMFNYFADNVPSGFKWLAALAGIKGDGAKGLSYIQKAADAANLTQLDAEYILFYIYSQKQGHYDVAQDQVAKLFKAYPNNSLFWFDLGEMRMRNKKFAESHALLEKFLKDCDANPTNCKQKYRYLANFFNAWGYIDDNQPELGKPFAMKARDLDNKVYKDRTKLIKEWYKKLHW